MSLGGALGDGGQYPVRGDDEPYRQSWSPATMRIKQRTCVDGGGAGVRGGPGVVATGGSNVFAILRSVAAQFCACPSERLTVMATTPSCSFAAQSRAVGDQERSVTTTGRSPEPLRSRIAFLSNGWYSNSQAIASCRNSSGLPPSRPSRIFSPWCPPRRTTPSARCSSWWRTAPAHAASRWRRWRGWRRNR